MTKLIFLYIPIKRPFPDYRGRSEQLVRRRLEKLGWEIFLGGCLDILKREELYPNVRKKYEKACMLVQENHPGTLEHLQYISAVHHGMPDFLVHRKGALKFVECKLGHEQLTKSQLQCFPKLAALGFNIEVHKIVFPPTKIRRSIIDIKTKEKVVFEKQLRLKKRWK